MDNGLLAKKDAVLTILDLTGILHRISVSNTFLLCVYYCFAVITDQLICFSYVIDKVYAGGCYRRIKADRLSASQREAELFIQLKQPPGCTLPHLLHGF